MNKLIINLSLTLAMLASCSPTAEKKANALESERSTTNTTVAPTPEQESAAVAMLPKELAALVPIALLDSTQASAYDKYGLEFSGNCYACDLASLAVNKDNIIWTNVCDAADSFKISYFSFSSQGNEITLKTAKNSFTLTLIDKTPVYKLVIEGPDLILTNKRIATYFTTKQALPLFKENDCGDFDG